MLATPPPYRGTGALLQRILDPPLGRTIAYRTDGFALLLCSGFRAAIALIRFEGLHAFVLLTRAAVMLWIWMIASEPQSIVRTDGLLI